jgi:hypothetical protein
MIFHIHRYLEKKKVKLAVVEFTDYAMVWWERLVVKRRRNRERPVSTWEKLKTIMKTRYVHLAIKVEGQLKRKGNTLSRAYLGSSLGWKMNYRREGSASSKPLVTSKAL